MAPIAGQQGKKIVTTGKKRDHDLGLATEGKLFPMKIQA